MNERIFKIGEHLSYQLELAYGISLFTHGV